MLEDDIVLADILSTGGIVTTGQVIDWTRTHLEGKRVLLASIAILLWDWMVSFDLERRFIWDNPWTATKILFLLNRYFPFVHSCARFWAYSHENDPRLSAIACGPILDIAAYGSVISVAIIEVILMLRLWAMYARNRLFGIFLVCVFVVGIGIALAIRKVEPPDNFKLVREAPQILTICKRSSPSELFFLYAIILVVETMTFGLLLLKVWQLSAVGVAPILKTMLKHGTQYYLVVFAALLLQVLGTVLQPLWQPMADSLPVVTIASISCSRLVLSLRGINAAPREATTIQDFQARPNYETQPVPLSVFRASRGSKAFVGTSTSTTSNTNTTEYERGTMHYGTYRDSYHPPIHEEDEDEDEMERSTSKDDDIGSPPRHPLGSSDNSHWRSGGHAI